MLFPVLIFASFLSTILGGLFALKFQDRLHRLLGFAAGVLLGVVAFDLLPEIFNGLQRGSVDPMVPMIALVAGFLAFHIIEKTILLHHNHESDYGAHKHPQVGILSGIALSGHSFLDGLGIGLGFQIDARVGVAVAIAVIAHDFTDGLNTVGLMLLHKNSNRRAIWLLLLDAFAPVLGAVVSTQVSLSEYGLLVYLGFFAGFLLYIGASEILPEAHSTKSSYGTLLLTIAGAAMMYAVSRIL